MSKARNEFTKRDLEKQLSFSKVDQDASGTIELEEVQSVLPQIPSETVAQIFADADTNKDGHLDRKEYSSFLDAVKTHTGNLAEIVVLPRSERSSARLALQASTEEGDGESKVPVKVEKKFPFFITTISIVQILMFLYLNNDTVTWLFVFHPARRYEIWRFVSEMLVHKNRSHLLSNVIMQLILGCLLEVIHHWKRVGAVYLGGVIFGSLASSVMDPWSMTLGASGGVYALLIAHIATIILNWSEMGCACLRCFTLSAFIAFDVGLALLEILIGKRGSVSHSGHLGGALAGLLIGINVLKNFKQRPCEIKLQAACRIIALLFVIGCVIANIGLQICYFAADADDFERNYMS